MTHAIKIRGWPRLWQTGLLATVLALAVAGAALQTAQRSQPKASAPAAHTGTIPITEFARIVQDFSEEGGYFFSDNFTSNESAYLYILEPLRQLGGTGGAYVGVGPEQNFTYIAKVRPQIAFIIDIRRQAILQHLMYKAVFQLAPDRAQFLSLLLSRPLTAFRNGAKPPGRDTPIDETLRYMAATPTSQEVFDANLARIEKTIQKGFHVPLTAKDRGDLSYVYRAFWRANLEISFRVGGSPYGQTRYGYAFPTLTDLILATDQQGRRGNFLARDEDYQFVRELQLQNRIIPVVGDFAGPKALATIGDYLRKNGYTLTLFYASNVEQFLFEGDVFKNFAANLRHMPINRKSLILRSVRSNSWMRTAYIPGHRFTPLLEFLSVFFQDYDQGLYRDYWSLVNTHSISAPQP